MSAPRHARELPQRYRLEAARCRRCKKVAFPPRPSCAGCGSEETDPVRLGSIGQVVSWTVVHAPAEHFATQAPYILAIVELGLGDGPRVRVTAQIVDARADEIEFGARVEHVMRRVSTGGADGIIHYGYKFVIVREASEELSKPTGVRS